MTPAHADDLPVTVVRRTLVAADTAELELRRSDGSPLPDWRPGAHVDLVLDDGTARQYSLCGDPRATDTYRVAVLRQPDGRGGSVRIHDLLDVGSTLHLRGPRNHFPLQEASRYLFLAGGIGITPLLTMIREVDARGAPWTLGYCGRTSRSMAYLTELRHLDPDGSKVTLAVSQEGRRLDLRATIGAADRDAVVYCCGPERMLAETEEICRGTGHRFHAEHFAPKEVESGPDTGFRVRIASSGDELAVPVGRTIADVLFDNGVDVLTSCEEGTCGTCETTVLEGVPDHRDSILTEDEQAAGDRIMLCISRSRSPVLVLDL